MTLTLTAELAAPVAAWVPWTVALVGMATLTALLPKHDRRPRLRRTITRPGRWS